MRERECMACVREGEMKMCMIKWLDLCRIEKIKKNLIIEPALVLCTPLPNCPKLESKSQKVPLL